MRANSSLLSLARALAHTNTTPAFDINQRQSPMVILIIDVAVSVPLTRCAVVW